MLRIIDARTGEPIDVRPGLVRVHVHVTGAGTSALRVLLVADVLARALEMAGMPVVTVAAPCAALQERAQALGIRPAEPDSPGPGRALHVVGTEHAAPEGARIEVAPAGGPAETADAPCSPSALRLALLWRPRGRPLALDPVALSEARDTLGRWRAAVAGWATHPSRPVPEDVRQELRAAWENDLDVPAVLRVLERVELDDGLPEGARFETYAYADRLLGLGLAREIGTLA
ncbi:hypothetical protein ACIHAA_29310 [Streptomyces sp. NPDC052040]|uniref:hypothetical protein n=1 Tax=unclassified Streptomyces TaxID=2593676 RepID=UPI0037D35751